jgi:hypothetical protein
MNNFLFAGPDRPRLREILTRARGGIPTDGSVGDLRILHDDWCELLQNGGDCTCDPQVVYDESWSG